MFSFIDLIPFLKSGKYSDRGEGVGGSKGILKILFVFHGTI